MTSPSTTGSLWDRIELLEGDITKVACDAIVNAANQSLLGGGGVDGAIHRAAGRELLAECRGLGGCATGSAKLTQGYNLPSKFVIHTVGPVYGGGDRGEPDLLRSCYQSSLALALENGVRTIAFPAISCGVYGYPVKEAAHIALSTTASFLSDHDQPERVLFVLFSQAAMEQWSSELAKLRWNV